MATGPAFATTPRIGVAQIATINTGRDGTGTLGSVITGVAAGTKINRVVINATVTTTAGTVRLFIDDGTNVRLFDETVVTAITVGASTPAFRAEKVYDDLVLPSASHILKAGTEKGEAINVFAFGADL